MSKKKVQPSPEMGVWRARALVAVLLLSPAPAFSQSQEKSGNKPGAPVAVEMRNVMYHFTDSVAVHIRTLQGQLEPKGELRIFDDKQSFTLDIKAAEIAMTPGNLANVLNSYVFAAHDAPLKAVNVSIENGALKVKGNLHSKGDVPGARQAKGHR